MELEAFPTLPAFEKLGASLVAISPQKAPNSRKSVRQNELSFPILSDPHDDVACMGRGPAVGATPAPPCAHGALSLRFTLPDFLVDVYHSLKNELPGFNGDPSWTLPMPGRFVVGQDGTILYAGVNPDYTRRPEPEDMLPALRRAASIAA